MVINIEEKFPIVVDENSIHIIKIYNKQLGIEPKIELNVVYIAGGWHHVLYFGSKKEKSYKKIIKELKEEQRKFDLAMDRAYS